MLLRVIRLQCLRDWQVILKSLYFVNGIINKMFSIGSLSGFPVIWLLFDDSVFFF